MTDANESTCRLCGWRGNVALLATHVCAPVPKKSLSETLTELERRRTRTASGEELELSERLHTFSPSSAMRAALELFDRAGEDLEHEQVEFYRARIDTVFLFLLTWFPGVATNELRAHLGDAGDKLVNDLAKLGGNGV